MWVQSMITNEHLAVTKRTQSVLAAALLCLNSTVRMASIGTMTQVTAQPVVQ